MADEFHQPAQSLFATRAKRGDDLVVTKTSGKWVQRHERLDRVPPARSERSTFSKVLCVPSASEVYAAKSPEDKVASVGKEAVQAATLLLGDGINDAPATQAATQAATVGAAFGVQSDITLEAADAVILETLLGSRGRTGSCWAAHASHCAVSSERGAE